MNKREKLAWAITSHPDHELICMYSNECADDYSYTMGGITRVIIDSYHRYGERIYLMNDDYEELRDDIEESLFYQFFNGQFPLNEEQNEKVEGMVKEELLKCEWKPAIIIYIDAV